MLMSGPCFVLYYNKMVKKKYKTKLLKLISIIIFGSGTYFHHFPVYKAKLSLLRLKASAKMDAQSTQLQ